MKLESSHDKTLEEVSIFYQGHTMRYVTLPDHAEVLGEVKDLY